MTNNRTPSNAEDAADGIDMTQLESLVGYNLRRAAARQRERFRNTFLPFDIRPVQLTVLTLILYNDRIGQSTLGSVLGMKRANVVKLLDELQQRELIERRPSIRDRRAYDVRLTGKGTRFTRELLDVHEKLEADLALAIGEAELKLLVDLLRRFRTVNSEPRLA